MLGFIYRNKTDKMLRLNGNSWLTSGPKADLCAGVTDLSQAPDLLDRDVEPVQVQGLPAHGWQVGHAHGLLLGEGQVTIHPQLPLGLPSQLVQLGDLLVGRGRGTGLLGEGKRDQD